MIAAGPSSWPENYPECGASNQSPIDIQTASTVAQSSSVIELFYDVGSYFVSNTLRSGTQIISARVYFITFLIFFSTVVAVPLTGTNFLTNLPFAPGREFDLGLVEFHWGTSVSGSEHTINGVQYALEMQMFHFDVECQTFDNATNVRSYIFLFSVLKICLFQYPGAIVAISVFFQPSITNNYFFLPMTNALPHINYGANTTITKFDLFSLVEPVLTGNFVTYKFGCSIFYVYLFTPYFSHSGSFTFPSCEQVVSWIIFTTTTTASANQVSSQVLSINYICSLFLRSCVPFQTSLRVFCPTAQSQTTWLRTSARFSR